MDIKDRPYVFLRLEKRLHDVIKHESKQLGDGFLLNGESMLGQFIINRISVSLFPPRCTSTDEDIKLYLPVGGNNYYYLNTHFFSIDPFAREQIQSEVNLFLRLKAWQWDIEGRKMGFGEKQIVESFLAEWGMRQSEDAYEMIKKIMYRERKNTREGIARMISGDIVKRESRTATNLKKKEKRPELFLFDEELC